MNKLFAATTLVLNLYTKRSIFPVSLLLLYNQTRCYKLSFHLVVLANVPRVLYNKYNKLQYIKYYIFITYFCHIEWQCDYFRRAAPYTTSYKRYICWLFRWCVHYILKFMPSLGVEYCINVYFQSFESVICRKSEYFTLKLIILLYKNK